MTLICTSNYFRPEHSQYGVVGWSVIAEFPELDDHREHTRAVEEAAPFVERMEAGEWEPLW